MISMPKEYKQSMASKLRNRSYMSVSIGVINQAAQSGAYVSGSQDATYSYLSNFNKLFDNYDADIEYATLEQDFFKVNGSMLFPPRKGNNEYIYNVGTISEPIKGIIVIGFDNTYDIRGMTIDFGEKYPVDFSISNGTKTTNFSDNKESYFVTDEIFEQTEHLVIVPTKMSNENGRLRIHKIFMGVGIVFDNTKILRAEKTDYISPVSEELSTMDFSLEIENYNRLFDVENKTSAIHYLEIGQEVKARYGYDVTGNGDITWIDGCTCLLADWESDDETMSFSAKDRIDYLEEIYYGGKYRSDGISLYELAIDVLEDAGLDNREYFIDEYLKTVIVQNPLPCVTHKECLQIIANAGRCKVYTDRQGVICIKSAFITVVSPERMAITSEDATEWSDLQSVINGETKYEYATFSKNHAKTNGTMRFLPRENDYLPSGFVSESVSDESGSFEENPKFKIKLEAATTYFSLQLNFSSNPATEVIIHTYYMGELRESHTVSGLSGLENTIEHEFSLFDTIEFEFTKGQPNSRVFVDSVVFGEVTDYRMDYSVMTKTPKGKQSNKVSRVDVKQNIYAENSDEATIFQETIDVTNSEDYTFFFSTATYDVSVTADGDSLEIVDNSSYFVTVDVSNLTGEKEFIVNGREYIVTNKVRSVAINPTGKIEEWDNPLISSSELAELQAEWLGNYFANNIEYDISYRGEPRIDSNDILFLENKYVNNLQIQVYEHTLNFNGALSGNIKARRAVAQGG